MATQTTIDPELTAMSTVASAFESLDEDARRRILRWATEKYGVRSVIAKAGESHNRWAAFDDFATLFSQADPGTEADKALVAAYWLQVVEGHERFESQQLNEQLKNLGHGVKNITSALEKLIARKPRLIMQVRKGGPSKQARKQFQLTVEGSQAVIRMLEAGLESV